MTSRSDISDPCRLLLALAFICLSLTFALADTAGPVSPSAAIEDQASGSTAWANYDNVFSSNNSYAVASLAPLSDSYFIKATGFGFTLPANAIVKGIAVEIEKRADSANIQDQTIKLVKGGLITGDNKADGAGWPVLSDAYRTHGGTDDLWGISLTRDEVNAANFGVAVSAHNTDASLTLDAKVDHLRLIVTFTLATGRRHVIVSHSLHLTPLHSPPSIAQRLPTGQRIDCQERAAASPPSLQPVNSSPSVAAQPHGSDATSWMDFLLRRALDMKNFRPPERAALGRGCQVRGALSLTTPCKGCNPMTNFFPFRSA